MRRNMRAKLGGKNPLKDSLIEFKGSSSIPCKCAKSQTSSDLYASSNLKAWQTETQLPDPLTQTKQSKPPVKIFRQGKVTSMAFTRRSRN